jgi:hypothetical protein
MSAVQEYSEALRKFFFGDSLCMRIFEPLLGVEPSYTTKFCIWDKCYTNLKAVLVLQRDFDTTRNIVDYSLRYNTNVLIELLCFDWVWQACFKILLMVDRDKKITLCIQAENWRTRFPTLTCLIAEDLHELCADLLLDVLVPGAADVILAAETLCDVRNVLIAPNILTLVRSIYEEDG